jgi:hypothetical protein
MSQRLTMLGAIALVAGPLACARAPRGGGPSAASSAASASATLAPVAAASASAALVPEPPKPWWQADGLKPEALGPFAARDRPAACAACHAEIAREWRGSQHRRAYGDPYFQAAHALEPEAFCFGCHAPTARGRPADADAIDDGVSCAVCHVRGESVLGAGTSAGAGPRCARPVIVDAAMSSPAACAGCHQFAFPFAASDDTPSGPPLMQRTVDEWRASAAGRRGAGCPSCHMPEVMGEGGKRHRSHAFPGVDAALLQRAVRVEATATRDGETVTLTLALTSDKIGHALPTGDLYRTLVVAAEVAGRVRDRATLARVYRISQGRDAHGAPVEVRREVRDDRVLPGAPKVVVLRLRAAAGERIGWTVTHLRSPPAIAQQEHVDVGATEVARGEITAP